MSNMIEAIWINVNPSLKRFDSRIVRCLSQKLPIAYWEYSQTSDEGCCFDIGLQLLHEYLQSISEPVNLIGHSTGGLLGLLYARKYPQKVKSLTLLGVGFHPAIDWQMHYYALRKMLSCSQEIVLAKMVQKLFGNRDLSYTKSLTNILLQDLNSSLSPHSLYRQIDIAPSKVSMPLMVCGSDNDEIVDRHNLNGWLSHFKEEDILWSCPQGKHFFHYFFPDLVSRQIVKFWKANCGSQKIDARCFVERAR